MNIKYNFYFWLCNFKMIIYGHVSVPYTLTLDRKKTILYYKYFEVSSIKMQPFGYSS